MTEKESIIKLTFPVKKNFFQIAILAFGILGSLTGMTISAIGLYVLIANGFPLKTVLLIGLFAAFTGGFLFALKNWLWMIGGKEIVSWTKTDIQVTYKNNLFKRNRIYLTGRVRNLRVKTSKTTTVESHMTDTNPWTDVVKKSSLNKSITIVRFQFDYDQSNIRIAEGIEESKANEMLNLLIERKFINQINLADSNQDYIVKL
jgi:hypothetical protein